VAPHKEILHHVQKFRQSGVLWCCRPRLIIGPTTPGPQEPLLVLVSILIAWWLASNITRPPAVQRSTTSAGHASPATINVVDSSPSGESIATADGV